MTQQREDLYFNLIDQLLRCPNGQEPEVLIHVARELSKELGLYPDVSNKE
jgi:hypothetical protein